MFKKHFFTSKIMSNFTTAVHVFQKFSVAIRELSVDPDYGKNPALIYKVQTSEFF